MMFCKPQLSSDPEAWKYQDTGARPGSGLLLCLGGRTGGTAKSAEIALCFTLADLTLADLWQGLI